MDSFSLFSALAFLLALGYASASKEPTNQYEPTWESLDSRPLPQWYPNAKFGIFIHWGVFSVPSYGNEWFWFASKNNADVGAFINRTEPPGFHYQEYAPRFRAELYDPQQWADLFADAGAQYVVLTSKHHEGFTMWDSRDVPTTWNWNAVDVGPKRDVLAELCRAVRNSTSPMTSRGLKFGVYHSLFEWFNPTYQTDQRNNFTTSTFPKVKAIPELYDLVNKYQPDLIWSDGDWDASSDYWTSKDFLAWYANQNPQGVWNDRWGKDSTCKHGSYLTCQDRYRPNVLPKHKWENCFTVDRTSWGFSRKSKYEDYYTTKELIDVLISTVALNGNLLLNVGPASDGTIHPIFADRLLGIGEWLKVNGEAIYDTSVWKVGQKEGDVYYTTKDGALYAIATTWPKGNVLELELPVPTQDTVVTMLGLSEAGATKSNKVLPTPLSWSPKQQFEGMQIVIPSLTPDILPCQHAWVFKMTDLQNIREPVRVRGSEK